MLLSAFITVRACQEFCPRWRGEGGSAPFHAAIHPLSGPTSLDTHTPWTSPPPEMATAADGTHPTGMHSCLTFQASQSQT